MRQFYREKLNKKNIGYVLKDNNPNWLCFYSFYGITSDDITKDDFLKKYEEVDETTNVYLNLLEKNSDKQMIKATEELAELTQAIDKMMIELSEKHKDKIIEETADVEIMLEQVKLYYDIDQSTVEEQKQAKIKRTIERCLHDD